MASRDIIAVCQRLIRIPKLSNDCAAFVCRVASDCGVPLAGDANMIVGLLNAGLRLPNGQAAKHAAANGDLVIAGVQAPGHGHVVVVVDGPMNQGRNPGKYPYAFWGQYYGFKSGDKEFNIGFTRGHGTLNYAFKGAQLNSVFYATFTPITSLLPRAAPNEGYLIQTFT
jgi:hypothetical protein